MIATATSGGRLNGTGLAWPATSRPGSSRGHESLGTGSHHSEDSTAHGVLNGKDCRPRNCPASNVGELSPGDSIPAEWCTVTSSTADRAQDSGHVHPMTNMSGEGARQEVGKVIVPRP